MHKDMQCVMVGVLGPQGEVVEDNLEGGVFTTLELSLWKEVLHYPCG